MFARFNGLNAGAAGNLSPFAKAAKDGFPATKNFPFQAKRVTSFRALRKTCGEENT
jgi:hypothetical protein